MRSQIALIAISAALVVPIQGIPVQAQRYDPNNLPRLQGAELLEEGYLPKRKLLATEDKAITLPEYLTDAFLSISADGSIIGCVRPIPGSISLDERRIVSTYSVTDGRLTDYLEITGFWGSSAISPDGEKMAYVTSDPLPDSFGVHLNLRLLDFKTGNVKSFSSPSGNVGQISWSSNGRRIAFDMESRIDQGLNYRSEIRAINIVDVESGKVSNIGVGMAPSWSPSGEWIAYVAYVPTEPAYSQPSDFYAGLYYAINDFQIRLMSTVETRSRVFKGFHSEAVPNLKPVWSPDSQTLLFQVMDPDKGTVNIYLVDVVTGKATKRFRNVAPVSGWVAAK